MALQVEVGEGRAWAVITANQIVNLRPEDAVAACAAHSAVAMDVLEDVRSGATRKDLGAINRYGRAVSNICTGWSGMGVELLPESHEDLDLFEGSQRVFGGKIANNYNPDARYPSTVTNRLRVVRLALPEALRQIQKPSHTVKRQVADIAKVVEPISKTPASRSGGGGWSRWY